MQKIQTYKRRKKDGKRKSRTVKAHKRKLRTSPKCIDCPMFERYVNWGLCKRYHVEIGLVLAKKARVCKDW